MALQTGTVDASQSPRALYIANDWAQVTVTVDHPGVYLSGVPNVTEQNSIVLSDTVALPPIILRKGDGLYVYSRYPSGARVSYIAQALPWTEQQQARLLPFLFGRG